MNTKILLAVTVIGFLLTPFVAQLCAAQETDQTAAVQQGANDDPIRRLNLTAEQREQIRVIRQSMQAERTAINQRLRETNRALEDALESDNLDEALIEQRLRDLAAAQAAQIRMRVLSEVRIRRVLNPEQRVLLRDLRQAAREMRRLRLENHQNDRIDAGRFRNRRRDAFRPLVPRNSEVPPRARP